VLSCMIEPMSRPLLSVLDKLEEEL